MQPLYKTPTLNALTAYFALLNNALKPLIEERYKNTISFPISTEEDAILLISNVCTDIDDKYNDGIPTTISENHFYKHFSHINRKNSIS
jgi:hypothetical protein